MLDRVTLRLGRTDRRGETVDSSIVSHIAPDDRAGHRAAYTDIATPGGPLTSAVPAVGYVTGHSSRERPQALRALNVQTLSSHILRWRYQEK